MDDWYPTPARENGHRRSDRQRQIRRWITRCVIVGAFLILIVGVAYFINRSVDWFHVKSTTTTTQVARGAAVEVTVDPGMTASEVGRLLEDKGVVDSSADFVDLVKERGTEEALRPGIYEFYKDQALVEVVEMLEEGKASPIFQVTIREGLSVHQVGDYLTEQGSMDGAVYVELSGTPAKFVVPKVGDTTPELTTLEGLLFPSTYFLMEGDGATELIGKQLDAFQSNTASLPWENAAALGLTPYEIVIVASLIEKEVSVPEERAKVAAVIYNRLKEPTTPTLGIDATVRYALNKWTGALTRDDLATQSPYNTYVVKGLPPTPISNPGVAALEAALSPADVDYLYYVLEDTKGHHFFTASYDEFLEAKKNQPDQ
jgi:UPF0755 protein